MTFGIKVISPGIKFGVNKFYIIIFMQIDLDLTRSLSLYTNTFETWRMRLKNSRVRERERGGKITI